MFANEILSHDCGLKAWSSKCLSHTKRTPDVFAGGNYVETIGHASIEYGLEVRALKNQAFIQEAADLKTKGSYGFTFNAKFATHAQSYLGDSVTCGRARERAASVLLAAMCEFVV